MSEASLRSNEEQLELEVEDSISWNPTSITWSPLNYQASREESHFIPQCSPGPRLTLPDLHKEVAGELKPLHVFLKTFPVLNLLKQQTNLHAAQKDFDAAFSKPEIKGFLAYVIAMGLVKVPDKKLYWTESDELFNFPFFTKHMKSTLFFNILHNLHLADSAKMVPRGKPGHDRLYLVRAYMDVLRRAWQEAYQPQQSVSVDEMMLPYKGRTLLRQYIKSKPTKWGLKMWALCESPSGYIYNMDLYSGKTGDIDKDQDDISPSTDAILKSLGSRTVWRLAQPLMGQWYCIYMDNFFSSPDLFGELFSKYENSFGSCIFIYVVLTGSYILLELLDKTVRVF